MLNEETIKSVIDIVRQVLNEENIDISSSKKEYQKWDSLAQLIIMMKLEENIGIKINLDEISNLTSVRQILEIVEIHKNESQV